MEFNEYQRLARLSDQSLGNDPTNIIVPVLGLVGEAGSLADIFKKWLRDGINFETQRAFAKTELGDVLWYLANIATRFDLSLEEIASHNLERTKSRYGFGASRKDEPQARQVLDHEMPEAERFPRRIVFHFWEEDLQGQRMAHMAVVHATPNPFPQGKVGEGKGHGFTLGDPLRNNAQVDDGYRYHDAIHIAFLAVLGWSPVFRALMRLKRKSQPLLDEVEDSARAVDVEEGISTQLAERAGSFQQFLEERYIDNETLDLVLEHVSSLEVRIRPGWMWKQAISLGFRCLKELHENGGGYLDASLDDGTVKYSKLKPSW